MNDKVVSYLRTAVPVAWGSLVSLILQYVGGEVSQTLNEMLSSEAVTLGVTSLVIFAWYAIWRKIEPVLPAWLTRIVLGSNQTPVYTEN